MNRKGLADGQWDRIKDLLPGKATDRGVTARVKKPEGTGRKILFHDQATPGPGDHGEDLKRRQQGLT